MGAYDTAHRLTSVTDSFGNSVDYTLDAMGDHTVSNIENPSATVTRGHTATYDTLGRQLTDVGGMSQTHTYTWDSNSNFYQDTYSSVYDRYYRDALNRNSAQSFTGGFLINKSYDAHDRLLSVTDPNGHTTSYVYDGFGDLIQQTSPDTGTAVFYYDSDGNLTKKVDALSVTTNLTYDALDRVLTTTYPADTSENVAYTYDQTGTGFSFGIGRLTSVTDMAGNLTRAYDERGNLLTDKRIDASTTLTTSYTYDSASRVLSITYPDNSLLTYTRDAMGRITAVSDKPSGASSATTLASSITYEPFGPWAGLTYGNGITETPTWDADYRLTALTDIGTATAQNIAYTYFASDQPSWFTDNVTSTNTLSYLNTDSLFHLDQYYQGGNAWFPAYDSNGNRTSIYATSYSYTSGTNRLASYTYGSATTNITTNANGNITGFSPGFGTAAVTALAYNNANRLSSVSSSSGTLGSYVYDAFGRRISKTVGSNTTLYQYSGGALLAETKGGTETNYIYLNGRPLAMLTGTTFTYLHDDNLGTPRVATNASQTVVWKASYLPFGETWSTSGSATVNLRFPGQYYDPESGFNHNGFRDYVPNFLARYLEADPSGLYDNRVDLSAGLNPYIYAGDDPMRTIDPTGLVHWDSPYKVNCLNDDGTPHWDKTACLDLDKAPGVTAQQIDASNTCPGGRNNIMVPNALPPSQWVRVGQADANHHDSTFTIKTGNMIMVETGSDAWPPSMLFYFTATAVPLNANGSYQDSAASSGYFNPVQYSSGFTGAGDITKTFALTACGSGPATPQWQWTISIPPQEDTHSNFNQTWVNVSVPASPSR